MRYSPLEAMLVTSIRDICSLTYALRLMTMAWKVDPISEQNSKSVQFLYSRDGHRCQIH